ncbi:LuxR C-terminal-related transcriptional regulator [Streptomyces sp. NPDC005349]|uniref:helix-turn-helix domain-containing protein n=1 Tax=Streptomyces sp. NPDC005349 TaxID=3157037 RepID=UPI0033BD78E5
MIKLTARELEVLQLIANGFTHEEIAKRLFLSEQAVNDASRRARVRLGAHTTPHAVLLAERAGLLEGRTKKRRGPAREPLTGRQALVLTEAASGDSLATIAARIGTTRQQVSARLAEAYLRLGVTHLPRGERRAEAVLVARRRRLIPDAPKETAA